MQSDDCEDINGSDPGNLLVESVTDGNFVFQFKPTGAGICESIVTAHFRTNGVAAAVHAISYTITDSIDDIFENGNDTASTSNNVEVTVLSTVSITNARSFDSDGDGFLDGYRVTLNNPLPAPLLTPSQIAVTTAAKTATGIAFAGTPGSYTGTITWSDGLFDTGETPEIEIF